MERGVAVWLVPFSLSSIVPADGTTTGNSLLNECDHKFQALATLLPNLQVGEEYMRASS